MHATSNYIVYFNVSGQSNGKKLLEIIIFYFFNVFSSLGLIWVVTIATNLNFCQLFFFNMKHFSKYYKKVSNSESLSFIVIKH